MIVGGGVAGYVAAIKAGQEGLKVGDHEQASMNNPLTALPSGRLYREARHAWRNMSQCWMHPIEILA